MVATEKEKRIPFISHWGVMGADVDLIFTEQIKQTISYHFIQSCYSLASSTQSAFQRSVITRAQKLFPDEFISPENVKAPAGFIHAYDLGRLMISALQQVKLTGDIKQDRTLLRQALEHLQQPVQGLIKKYIRPFSKWDEQHQDAHEALGLENLCMATFGEFNQINVTAN